MKIFYKFIIFLLISCIFFIVIFDQSKTSKVDICLDKGYCWDYIRNKCEQNDQGFCFKNKQECNDRNGNWEEDEQYCKL